jgi:hypothetical protein
MNTEFQIVSRQTIGLPLIVRNSDGSARPALSDEPFMTIHYTGVNVTYGDPGDTPSEIVALQNYAVLAGKPFEYNYVIGQDDDPFIYEYAGTFRAAHSAGENDIAVGVLMFNGTAEPATDKQVRKIQWLRAYLIETGTLNAGVDTRPHQQMPGANTSCPGQLILNRWAEIETPYDVPPPPPPPPVPDDLQHLNYGLHYVINGDSPWKVAMLHYGSGQQWNAIVNFNAPDTIMNPGERWKIPMVKGVDLAVLPGEGAWSIIRRAGQTPSTASVQDFYNWNGGPTRQLSAGNRVFVHYT